VILLVSWSSHIVNDDGSLDWDILIILLRVFKVSEIEVGVVILLGIVLRVGVGVRVVSVRELLEVVTHEVDGAGNQLELRLKRVSYLLVTGDLEHDDVTLGEGDVEVGLLNLLVSVCL